LEWCDIYSFGLGECGKEIVHQLTLSSCQRRAALVLRFGVAQLQPSYRLLLVTVARPEDHRLQVESFQRMSDPAEIQEKLLESIKSIHPAEATGY
jgi:hypothetical protein